MKKASFFLPVCRAHGRLLLLSLLAAAIRHWIKKTDSLFAFDSWGNGLKRRR
jgi:hypothetical protein